MRSCSVLLACAASLACSPYGGGSSIGRPPFSEPQAAPLLPVQICQVYAAVDPNQSFVQLVNTGTAPLTLQPDSLTLLSTQGQIAVTAAPLTLQPGARLSVPAAALELHGAAGEVGAVDEQWVTQSYLAWGVPPALWDSGLAEGARSSNLPTAQAFVPVPFLPVPGVAVAAEPSASGPPATGCVAADPNRQTPATLAACGTTAQAAAELTEMVPAWPDGSGSWLEVRNLSSAPINLFGALLCRQSQCRVIDVDVTLTGTAAAEASDPNATSDSAARALLYIGQMREAADAQHVRLDGSLPLSTSEEIALAPPGDPNTLFAADSGQSVLPWSYVRVASTSPTTFAAGALHAAISDGTAVPPPTLPQDSIARNDTGGTQWLLARQTPLGINGNRDPNTPASWSGCSYPLRDAGVQGVAISEVHSGATAQVAVVNPTGASVELAGMSLVVNGTVLPLQGNLAAGQSQLVALAAPLAASGEATLLGAQSQVVHQTQWGDPAAPSAYGTPAQALGLWPGPACRASPLAQDDTLSLIVGRDGHSPLDYGRP